jgi:hypothetical protein
MLRSPLKVDQCFRGTCRLHFQGRRISQARNQRAAGGKLSNRLAVFPFLPASYITWNFGKPITLPATWFTLVSCLIYSSTLMMEGKCSSETSVDFQWTTQHYIPEDRTLQNHCCENLKSYINNHYFQDSPYSTELAQSVGNLCAINLIPWPISNTYGENFVTAHISSVHSAAAFTNIWEQFWDSGWTKRSLCALKLISKIIKDSMWIVNPCKYCQPILLTGEK